MLIVVAGSAALTACSPVPAGHGDGAATPAPVRSSPIGSPLPVDGPPAPSGSTSPPVTKALTIVLENRGAAAATDGMPQLVRLAGAYGQAVHYRAVSHPSLPNYLALAGGSTFGVTDDGSPAEHPVRGPSVFDPALGTGRTAKTYAEAMPTSCARRSRGRYAVKHNPWVYFTDDASRRGCAAADVPLGGPDRGALADDVAAGTLPQVGLVVPDLCHDAHDCPLSIADAWVSAWVSQVLRGPDWRAGRLAVVVTFDEAEKGSDNTVLTVVIAPGLHAVVASADLTHLSWTRWMSDLGGSAAPAGSGTAPSLGSAFGL